MVGAESSIPRGRPCKPNIAGRRTRNVSPPQPNLTEPSRSAQSINERSRRTRNSSPPHSRTDPNRSGSPSLYLKRRSTSAVSTELSAALLTPRSLRRAQERGLNAGLLSGHGDSYFAKTDLLRHFAQNHPHLLLLPWEGMRRMGAVVRRRITDTRYTFISHQWEQPTCPFGNEPAKLTQHLHLVTTPYVWIDWFCTPQWSRRADWTGGTDRLSECIFETTMSSFHKLCFMASNAVCLLKRVPTGLRFGPEDFGLQLRQAVNGIVRALESISAPPPVKLLEIIDLIDNCGIDLEYAVRAWCALERCYLPDTGHSDIRLTRVVQLLKQLSQEAEMVDQQIPLYLTSISADAESVAHLLSTVSRVEQVIELCKVNSENRLLYQNVWSYAFLKSSVFRITNKADYKYLDKLFISEYAVKDKGMLYLLSQAATATDGPKPIEWPSGQQRVPILSLLGAAIPDQDAGILKATSIILARMFPKRAKLSFPSPESSKMYSSSRSAIEPSLILEKGEHAALYGGLVHVSVMHARFNSHKLRLRVTNLGVCAAEPGYVEFELTWRGSLAEAHAASLMLHKSRHVAWHDLPFEMRQRKRCTPLEEDSKGRGPRQLWRTASTQLAAAAAKHGKTVKLIATSSPRTPSTSPSPVKVLTDRSRPGRSPPVSC